MNRFFERAERLFERIKRMNVTILNNNEYDKN